VRVLLSWSTGKDSAWALHTLRSESVDVVGLLSTTNEMNGRVSMHGTRRELLRAQGEAVGLPVWDVPLPDPCPNEEYQRRMLQVIERAGEAGVTHIAFGDVYLEDIRAYREEMLRPTGIEPLFPIWLGNRDTTELAQRMLASGVRATITCVDSAQLDPAFVGQRWDPGRLPDGVDPVGERGEFHTFCWAAPPFGGRLHVTGGEVVHRGGFWFADLSLSPR